MTRAVTAAKVLAELEQLGTEQNRRIYTRHGAGEDLYGVSFADLRALAKRLGRDTDLARELWATGNVDARLLACMVADPGEVTSEELDAWVSGIRYYALADEFAKLAAASPLARDKMDEWTASTDEFTGQVGYDILSWLAMNDGDLGEGYFAPRLGAIEREIADSANRKKYAMNGALIAIGRRDPALKVVALEVARRIGEVHVDHGDTGCKTPDAASYIVKEAPTRVRKAASG